MASGESGGRLMELIKKAIHDCEVSTSEYEEILKLANADGHVDSQEKALLSQLQNLMANGTVTRVKG